MAGWWWWWWKGGWCSWYDGGGRRPGPVCVRMRGLLSPGWKLTAVSPTLAVVGVSPGLSLGASQCSWGPAYWCANIPQVTLLLDVSCT